MRLTIPQAEIPEARCWMPNGRLIGINFDRNWEGTISDYEYDPAVCRNISLDIRYVLFIIDKYAGASNILKELTIE